MVKIYPTDKRFPPQLTELPDAPEQLYAKGDLKILKQRLVAVIGARRPSSYGLQATRAAVSALRGYPVAIVSGLAIGLDGEAHRAALAAGLPTIAVLPSGLENIYPSRHQWLADEIVKQGGLLISEYEPDHHPMPYDFIGRNRLIAGLSELVIITEGAERSGTRTTAELALEQGKEVAAIPGSIFSRLSIGPNRLIAQGAWCLSTPETVVTLLGFTPADQAAPDLTREEMAIWQLVFEGEHDLFGVQERLHQPVAAFNQALTALEIKGLVAIQDGKIYPRQA